jgi:hypothetical protein
MSLISAGSISLDSTFNATKPLLRIRDVYPDPGSEFCPFRIPDPNFFHTGSWIHITEFNILNPINGF